ncbi:hypothetical protein P7K49_004387 [Saguinus oedipus]|uniref:Uncharacterized protein n=1 Tax=Saguinus oedipus TaxID=9490 RepID=A0ABQ9W7Y4_SAGOE|nr:hypothetical protein P7K49_004387 [Saguinus oedipus]
MERHPTQAGSSPPPKPQPCPIFLVSSQQVTRLDPPQPSWHLTVSSEANCIPQVHRQVAGFQAMSRDCPNNARTKMGSAAPSRVVVPPWKVQGRFCRSRRVGWREARRGWEPHTIKTVTEGRRVALVLNMVSYKPTSS